ncbi:MAG: carbohydrate porin [Alphaproteobacteria bacterium]|nr:carbohydrate porin [Alphaproteobacteria bacterium]
MHPTPTKLAIYRTLIVACVPWSPSAVFAADEQDTAVPETPAISLQAAYTGDVWNVLSGGLDDGSAYLDDIDLQIAVDLDRTLGWSGAQFFFYALYNNGNSFSGDKIGDLNGVSNIETGLEALRIQEAWIDQTFADGHGSLRAGLYDLNSEFDAGEVRGLFMLSSHGIGPDFAQTGLNGPSIFPVTSMAARLNWTFDSGAYVRAAVLDGVPGDPEHPKRTTIDLDDGDGALIVAEVGLTNDHGRIWSLGAWTYTEDFPDLVTATPRNNNRGAYIALEESLLSRERGSDFDLAGALRFGVADDSINPLTSYAGASVVATGLITARPADQLGLAIAIASIGEKFQSQIADAGGEPADHEINLELTYYADVTDWLSVQPDLQWIVNPGADQAAEDTLVAGLRFQLKQNWDFD